MGNNTSTTTKRKEVENYINNELSINNQIINDFYHQTTNTVMTSMINNNSQSIQVDLKQMNRIELGTLIVDGGTFEACGDNVLVSKNASIMNVLQDTKGQNDIISELNSAFASAMSTNAQLAAAMESNSAITDSIKSAGGIASMVESVMEAITALGKQIGQNDVTSTDIALIKTTVQQKFNIKNNVTNKTKNIVTNSVQNMFKNESNSKCTFSTTQINDLKLGTIILKNGGKATLCQKNSLNAISECFVGSVQTESMVNGLTTSDKISATTDIKNSGGTTGDLKATAGVTTSYEMGSAFEDMIKSFSPAACGGICIVYCIVLALIIGGIFLLKSKGGGRGDD
jgi:hypothetical protein